MYLVEKHIINRNHSFYDECDNLCFQSKNIYNQGLYNVRQYFFKTEGYLNYNSNYHTAKEQECYNYLPTKVFCQTLKMVDQNFKSFFALLKKKKEGKYTEKIKIPSYLNKEKGRFVVVYPKQSIELREFKKTGKIHLSKSNIYLTTKVKNFNQLDNVRIVPKNSHYVIEVVYTVKEKEFKDTGIVSSIDLGMNNLASITFNDGSNPLIINGRPLKSMNQYYNKKKSKLQSRLKDRYTSNKIQKLTNKRNNKVNDYLHKSTHFLVNQLVSKNVSILIIGKNTSMKQDINMGKKNNQNFVQLPIFKFVDMLKYKAELQGIQIIFQEESYTSKVSFIDNDYIPVYGVDDDKFNPSGKRIKRGLYITKEGKKINADINGSYNIMRKAVPNAICHGIEGLGVNPLLVNIKG